MIWYLKQEVMNVKRMALCLMSLLAALSCTAAGLQIQQQAMADKLIRLHVRANSDSDHDQWVKLQVRDAVLQVTGGMTEAELRQSLPAIEAAAEACLEKLEERQPVRVRLAHEHFPTRLYDTFALPAGVYESLLVEIGSGEGHNWWCVVFPSLCLRASLAETQEAAVSAGFLPEEWKLITEDGGTYVLKFKLLELLDDLKQRF